MIHKFFLKKSIARRFINLGVPIKDACNFANDMDDTKSVLIIRNPVTFKPNLIVLIKTKQK